jgi:hypothetical protein
MLTSELPSHHCDLHLLFYTQKSGGIDCYRRNYSTSLSSVGPVNMSENVPPQELPIFTSADRIRQLNDMDKVLRPI